MARIKESNYVDTDSESSIEDSESSRTEQNDSGYGIEIAADEGNGVTGSGSLSRKSKYRNSFKRLKQRSEELLFRRVSSKCLKHRKSDLGTGSSSNKSEKVSLQRRSNSHSNIESSKISVEDRSADKDDSSLTQSYEKLIDAEKKSKQILQLKRASMISTTSMQSSLQSASQDDIWANYQSDNDSLLKFNASPDQEMERYYRILQLIANPLGLPDVRPGCRPMDLANYLQQVFEIETETQKKMIKQIKNSKVSNVVLVVTVFEACDLKSSGTATDQINPYCVLCVMSSTPKNSPRNSPRSSPSVSPSSSPLRGRRDFPEISECRQTEAVQNTTDPTWNQEFLLKVSDFQTQSFQLCVWNHSSQQNTDRSRERRQSSTQKEKDSALPPEKPKARPSSLKDKERKPSFKNLFRHFRSPIDACRTSNSDLLGQFCVPLRELPTCGCEKWCILSRDKRHPIHSTGRCRVHLKLAYEWGADDQEPYLLIVDDLLYLTQNMYRHAYTLVQASGTQNLVEISGQSQCILEQFVSQNQLKTLTAKIIELAVIMRLKIEHPEAVSSCLIMNTVSFINQQDCRGTVSAEIEQVKISEADAKAIDVLDCVVSEYLPSVVRLLVEQQLFPVLFPPHDLRLEELDKHVSTAIDLINLPLWSEVHQNSPSRKSFSTTFIQKLQDHIRDWLQQRLSTISQSDKDTILTKTLRFVEVLEDATKILSPIVSIQRYFNKLGVEYFKVASLTIESKLASMAQELILQMDHYQMKYHRFNVNVRESSIISLKHYFALRSFFETIRVNFNERELFRVSTSNYQDWFLKSVTFWLQTFRDECIRRMEKALEIDKDVVQVTCLVKYSNSSVDVLSCFSKITSEWQQIGFKDTDIAVLGVTKITDTICDCVRQYLDKIICILENNGYYDFIDNQQFDVTDQLCISLNNISHVRDHLLQLSVLLDWTTVTNQMSVRHEDESIGRQALEVLQCLVSSTHEDMLTQIRVLARHIISKISVDLHKYTLQFTRCQPDVQSSVDPLLEYLETNLKVLSEKLESDLFPMFLSEMWKRELQVFAETLAEGQPHVYYRRMHSHLNSVRSYFHCGGIEPRTTDCSLYCHLVKVLETNSLTSEELMLQYYHQLADKQATRTEYYGQLAVKIGYRRVDDSFITIQAKVIQAMHLPRMSEYHLSNPFVMISLCPVTLFPLHVLCKTKVLPDTVNPCFEEKFEFGGVKEEERTRSGSTLVFSVWHYESFLPNEFLGEAVISLNELYEMTSKQTIDDVPATIRLLQMSRQPREGPYMVVKERCATDPLAKLLIQQRTSIVAFKPRCRFCKPLKSIVSSVTGKRFDVVASCSGTVTTIE